MKKIFTLVICSVFIMYANAQFQKGNKVLGLGLNVGQTSNNSSNLSTTQSNTGFGINGSLSLARAKSESRLNGFELNIGYRKITSKSNNPYINNQFSENYNATLGYFMRKYKPLGKNFFVFGEAQVAVNYNRQIIRMEANKIDEDRYNVGLGIYPGLAYKWNDRFLFELRFADFAALSYNYTEQKDNNNKSYSRGLSFGTSLGLGYLNNIGIGARWIIK